MSRIRLIYFIDGRSLLHEHGIEFLCDFVHSQFDIREKHTCRKDDKIQLINLPHHMGPNAEAKCVAVNQRRSELIAVGANDVYARIYDRRMLTLGQVSAFASNSLEFLLNFLVGLASINFSNILWPFRLDTRPIQGYIEHEMCDLFLSGSFE